MTRLVTQLTAGKTLTAVPRPNTNYFRIRAGDKTVAFAEPNKAGARVQVPLDAVKNASKGLREALRPVGRKHKGRYVSLQVTPENLEQGREVLRLAAEAAARPEGKPSRLKRASRDKTQAPVTA